ncbi:MAG TPA: hypothetical protein VHZ97_29885 [Pseudonocardiaceae bacterium]|jgi:hypothetical protein|nr:hypothetical protein [Pseudonocardiaceae bacterium]
MSVTVDYFFNSPLELPALAEQINHVLGSTLVAPEKYPEDYLTWFMGMEFDLVIVEGRFDDDRDLDFTSFRYSCGTRTIGSNRTRPVQIPVMLSVIQILQHDLDIGGIFVYDVQTLLARYERRNPPVSERSTKIPFVDVLSGTDLDDFAGHLAAVSTRR